MFRECWRCNSTGYIIVKNQHPIHPKNISPVDSNNLRWVRIRCPVCDGKGFTDDSPFKTTA